MKIIPFIIALLVFIPLPMSSQRTDINLPQTEGIDTDSIKVKDLNELIVEGRTQQVIKDGVEYIPGEKVKRNSFDAISLIRNMQIPSIIISEDLNKLQTITGSSVTLYINYRPAQENELNNLRTSDIIKIEVLKAPTDPRFKGEAAVINIIIRQYEYGGYTSVKLSGTTLSRDILHGTVYSKIKIPHWDFDICAGGRIYHDDNFGTDITKIYRNIKINNKDYSEIISNQYTNSSLIQRNAQWASFRIIYHSTKVYIEHVLSYNRKGEPCKKENGIMMYQPNIYVNPELSITETDQSITPGIEAYYSFKLDNNTTLIATWDFKASFNRHKYQYDMNNISSILNHNRESTLQPNAGILLTRKFGQNKTFRIFLSTFNDIFNTEYSGSFDELQKLYSSESFALAQYSHRICEKLRIDSQLGVSYVAATINGNQTLNEWNPRFGLGVYYMASSRLNLSLEGGWFNNHPSPSDFTDALVRKDEILWLKGNPDIKNTLGGNIRLSADYIPNNWLNFALSINYDTNRRLRVSEYYTLPDHDGLVCRKTNSGNFNSYNATIGATAKLFGNSLIVGIQGSAYRNIISGIYAGHHNILKGNVNATYYFGNFSTSLYIKSPNKEFGAWDSGLYSKGEMTYGIRMTFGSSNFKAELSFDNWLRKRGSVRSYFNSPLYSFSKEEYNPDLGNGRNLILRLSYTIGYGKQISRDYEMETEKQGHSAILR